MQVNGTEIALNGNDSLLDFVQAQGFDPRTVVVERNGDIVPRTSWSTVRLDKSDIIEILHFVGGG